MYGALQSYSAYSSNFKVSIDKVNDKVNEHMKSH